jgi:hypothetical protein
MSGSLANPSGREAWSINPDPADELRVVSVLEDAYGIADGEQVAEWVLTDVVGRQLIIPMLAGRDTADWTYDDPLFSTRPAHRRARVAFTFELPAPLPDGGRQVSLFYSAFALTDHPRVVRAELRYTHSAGRLQLYGFAFRNQAEGPLSQFFAKDKYSTVFESTNVVIQENRQVFPRAFAVPEAIVADSSYQALDLLAHGPIQPRRQVVLETDQPAEPASPGTMPPAASDRLGGAYGEVEILDYRNERVEIQVESDGGYLVLADAHYPGWRAYVDGYETPVLRADYLFRAVELPPGAHLVKFRYEPASFGAGSQIGRLALALAAIALLATLVSPLSRGGRSPTRGA